MVANVILQATTDIAKQHTHIYKWDLVSYLPLSLVSSEGGLGNGVSAMALWTKACIQQQRWVNSSLRLQPSEATNMQQTIGGHLKEKFRYGNSTDSNCQQPTHIVCMTDLWLLPWETIQGNQRRPIWNGTNWELAEMAMALGIQEACLEAWVNRMASKLGNWLTRLGLWAEES